MKTLQSNQNTVKQSRTESNTNTVEQSHRKSNQKKLLQFDIGSTLTLFDLVQCLTFLPFLV